MDFGTMGFHLLNSALADTLAVPEALLTYNTVRREAELVNTVAGLAIECMAEEERYHAV